MSKPLKLLTLGFVLALVPSASGQVTDDLDGDGIPDRIEGEVCGRAAVRDLVNDLQVPYQCVSSTDLEFEAGIVDEAVEEIQTVLLLVDADSDAIPDALEPSLCSVENQNSDDDGTCIGQNFFPPANDGTCNWSGSWILALCERDQGLGALSFVGVDFGLNLSVLGINVINF